MLRKGEGKEEEGWKVRRGRGFSIPRGDLPLVCHQLYRYLMKRILMPAPSSSSRINNNNNKKDGWHPPSFPVRKTYKSADYASDISSDSIRLIHKMAVNVSVWTTCCHTTDRNVDISLFLSLSLCFNPSWFGFKFGFLVAKQLHLEKESWLIRPDGVKSKQNNNKKRKKNQKPEQMIVLLGAILA